MSGSSLYEQDVLLWSEQQAAILGALARDRDLPNGLDIQNVADEIESAGLSELHGVESRLRLILAHLLTIALEPDSPAIRHREGELLNWHAELDDRFTPPMRQRGDLDKLWRQARKGVSVDLERKSLLPNACPLPVDALLVEDIDLDVLIEQSRAAMPSGSV